MTIKNKNKIDYGSVGLDVDEFEPKKVKIRVTTLIDEDVLLKLKEFAKKRGERYQSVLNALLRMFFDKTASGSKVRGLSEARVRRIVREELKKRA